MFQHELQHAISNLMRLPHYDSPYFWIFLIVSMLSGGIGGAIASTKGKESYYTFLFYETIIISFLSCGFMLGGLW